MLLRRPLPGRNRRGLGVGGLILPPTDLIAKMDYRYGVAPATASIDPDLTGWSGTGGLQTVTGTGPYVWVENGTTGTHRGYAISTLQDNHPVRSSARIKRLSGSRNFGIQIGAADRVIFDPGGAGVVDQIGTAVGSVTGPDGSGYYSVQVDADGTANAVVTQYVVDGTTISYTGDDSSGFYVDDVSLIQIRGETWSSQPPVTGPYATNPNLAEQPYYGDGTGGLVPDGVDDYLAFAASLGTHTDHTIIACGTAPAASGKLLYSFKDATNAVLCGRDSVSGLIAYWNGGGWKTATGTAGAYGKTVFTWRFNSSAGTGAIRIAGVEQTLSASTYVAAEPSSVAKIFTHPTAGYYWGGALYFLAIYKSVLAGGTLLQAERYAAAVGASAA